MMMLLWYLAAALVLMFGVSDATSLLLVNHHYSPRGGLVPQGQFAYSHALLTSSQLIICAAAYFE
jgi:hypothetical protein